MVEVIIALGILLSLSTAAAFHLKTLNQIIRQKENRSRALAAAVNFLELSKTIPFEQIKGWHGKKVGGGEMEVQITALNPRLCQIFLNSQKFNLITLRSNHE